MKIVLVRHGYSEGNKNGIFTGWSDVELSKEGIEELKQFKTQYAYPETDRYYASDLVRAVDTFDILFGDNETLHKESKQLREIYFGELEDIESSTVDINFSEMWSKNERFADWETRSEFSYRIVSKLERIVQDMKKENEESATIVCHSGVIRTFLVTLGHRPYMDFRLIDAPNGLGYILDLDIDKETSQLKLNGYKEITKK